MLNFEKFREQALNAHQERGLRLQKKAAAVILVPR